MVLQQMYQVGWVRRAPASICRRLW